MRLERISVEEAKKYVPLNENYGNVGLENASYFTLTPSKRGEGWEDVTYYTAKLFGRYHNLDDKFDSWVYVLSNPTLDNMFKIGYTKLLPDDRAKQISRATGVALPYKVEWAFNCFNGEALEREVHKCLDPYRVSNQREFFQISLEGAQNVIERIGKKYT